MKRWTPLCDTVIRDVLYPSIFRQVSLTPVKQNLCILLQILLYCAHRITVGIIRLAQELNIPEILPVAFYHLNRAYKVYPLPLDGLPIQATPETCVNTSILTVQDLKRLCIGKQRMVNMVHSFPFDLLERVSDQQEAYHPDCEYALADPPMADICGEKAKESLQVEKFLQELFIGGEDPLRDLSEAYKRSLNYRPTGVVCNSCERCIYDFFQGTRNMIWENLGKCFELEGDGGHL